MRTISLLDGLKKVGQLRINDKVVISDPCYDLDTWCIETTESLPLGMYDCFIKEFEGRVAEMWVLKEYTADVFLKIGEELGCCGVDSGQLGIFNISRFGKGATDEDLKESLRKPVRYADWERKFEEEDDDKERFYKVCCNHTLNNEQCGIFTDTGFISSSGWGDGSYYPDLIEDGNGNIVGLRVIFIGTDNEDEDEE